MEFKLIIIALIGVSIITCLPILRERTIQLCDREAFGEKLYYQLLTFFGRPNEKTTNCEVIRQAYDSSEVEDDENPPFARFKENF